MSASHPSQSVIFESTVVTHETQTAHNRRKAPAKTTPNPNCPPTIPQRHADVGRHPRLRPYRISSSSQNHVFESPVSLHNTPTPVTNLPPRMVLSPPRFKTNLLTILHTPHETRPVPPEQQLPAPKAEPSR